MAIVDGKRKKGWSFYKMKGRREWVAHNADTSEFFSLAAEYEGDTPLDDRFYYCSIVSQPNFLAYGHHPGFPSQERYTPSSWKKMPEGWRDIFRRDVFVEEA